MLARGRDNVNDRITYSVFRSAARRRNLSRRSFAFGIRAGEGKTCWAKPLPRSLPLWVLNGCRCFRERHHDVPGGSRLLTFRNATLRKVRAALGLGQFADNRRVGSALGPNAPTPTS
jgi:hypothetical protein